MADDEKRIYCHACEQTASVPTGELKCPHCNDDFIEELEAQQEDAAPLGDDADDLMQLMQQNPLLMLLSRLFQLRTQVAGSEREHDELSQLISQFQLIAADGIASNLGDYADDRRYGELLQSLFQQDGVQLEPTPEAIIEQLQSSVTKMSESAVDAGSPCSVCQASIQPDDNVLALGCSHPFHPECLVPWLKQASTCPLCRWYVASGDDS
eukprot:m.179782 g.179782  ORF g.179782 m.179782 type:complete len:210 (+) comp14855_c0_seq1:72-701(+)